MAISIVQPLPAGNAIRLFIAPPPGARYWLVLRSAMDDFDSMQPLADAQRVDHDGLPYMVWDDGAMVPIAYEGDERVVIDAKHLQNEVMAFYRPYYRMPDGSWQAAQTATGTPKALFEESTTDVQSFIRDRLEAGLKVECERENLVTEHGYVQVYTAPPALEQNLRFPLVTITLENECPVERGIGEDVAGDAFDAVGDDWFDSEGWLAQVQLSLVGWSLNSDERIELRKAMRRVILANLPIFESVGMLTPQVSFQDVDALSGEFNANMYQVMGSFSCLAPVRVGRRYGEGEVVNDVITRSTNG
ncbi:hypothetical protein FHR70_000749 [Microvirga lupini]|uniref:Uncharacterized protein n=1 Tax=Microvirga lupini TaxID=420324 RepID=A0A7W4VI95_9HYPH|nr:hypothetical protein [Microvirga lupini]MBB3017709.1 hypothetical protein [Microvirga lupini]